MLFGGPVETSRGLVLHSADYKRDETLLIEGGMALTASLEILKDMAGGTGPKNAWLALGHSGWAPGQLDREMQDNAWLVVDADAELVFDADFAAKWQRALDRLGGLPGGKFDLASFSPSRGAPDLSNPVSDSCMHCGASGVRARGSWLIRRPRCREQAYVAIRRPALPSHGRRAYRDVRVPSPTPNRECGRPVLAAGPSEWDGGTSSLQNTTSP